MIALFTDFGWHGPYIGQINAVLANLVPEERVIDLMHDAPLFNPRASAYLLANLVSDFPKDTIFLTVVDPGVGSSKRRACVVKTKDHWFVGPDNGLMNMVIRNAIKYEAWEIVWEPEKLSSSFHGRDLFAPIAAKLVKGDLTGLKEIKLNVEPDFWPDSLHEVIYIDHYGNSMTGVHSSMISSKKLLNVNDIQIGYARTFSEVQPGDTFWYINSIDMVELSVNQGDAAKQHHFRVGTTFKIM